MLYHTHYGESSYMGGREVEWEVYSFFFLSFCYFFGPLPWHMEVPRLGVKSEL